MNQVLLLLAIVLGIRNHSCSVHLFKISYKITHMLLLAAGRRLMPTNAQAIQQVREQNTKYCEQKETFVSNQKSKYQSNW
jgi:hypothetical protein